MMCFKCPYCKDEECSFNPSCDEVAPHVCFRCRA
jgi:hypothetical protein